LQSTADTGLIIVEQWQATPLALSTKSQENIVYWPHCQYYL